MYKGGLYIILFVFFFCNSPIAVFQKKPSFIKADAFAQSSKQLSVVIWFSVYGKQYVCFREESGTTTEAQLNDKYVKNLILYVGYSILQRKGVHYSSQDIHIEGYQYFRKVNYASDFHCKLEKKGYKPWIVSSCKITQSVPAKKRHIPVKAFPGKEQAYIMIGNLRQSDWSMFVFGFTRDDINKLIDELSLKLRQNGFDVHLVDPATKWDLMGLLMKPGTGAIVWISHGQLYQFTDSSGEKITKKLIKEWALRFLKRQGLYRDPLRCLTRVEQDRMIEIQQKVHFDLLYFFHWGCTTISDFKNSPMFRMMRNGGIVEGYYGPKSGFSFRYDPDTRKQFFSNFPSVHEMPHKHRFGISP